MLRGLGVFAFVLIACVGAGAVVGTFVWRSVGDRAAETARAAEEFAAEHEQRECAPEAIRRLGECGGLWCDAWVPGFASRCLVRARRSPDLCDDVPNSFFAARGWASERCPKKTFEEPFCRQVWAALADRCWTERSARPRTSGE